MSPLTLIYWLRAVLGMVIGVLCTAYVFFTVTSELVSIYTFLSGLSFALLFYIATYYVVKFKFYGRVEKQQKLLTQGIGIYFFAWLVAWTLIVSLMLPSVSVSIYNGGALAEGRAFWVSAENEAGVVGNITTLTGVVRFPLLPPDVYTFRLGNASGFVAGQNEVVSLGWLESPSINFNASQIG